MSAKCQKRTCQPYSITLSVRASTASGGYIVQLKSAAELVVHTDAKNIVGDTRAEAADQEGSARRHDRRNKCSRHGPKIDIDVLDLAGPISAEHALETSPQGPSNLSAAVAERRGYRRKGERIGTLRAGDVGAADRIGGVHPAVG